MKDYEKTYEEFWRRLVENEDGTLNLDAVKRELFDYHTALEEVPKVYMHVTNCQISKPNTRAEYIIERHDAAVTKAADEARAETLAEVVAWCEEADPFFGYVRIDELKDKFGVKPT